MSDHADLHAQFILNLDSDQAKETFEYYVSEHLRMSGAYWGCCAMALLGRLGAMDKEGIVAWVQQCFDPASGGYSGNVGHDPHLLYTLSAIQILMLFEADHLIPVAQVVRYISSLQNPDGSFNGDPWGEVDTRFSYCAFNALSLLNRLDAIDVDKALTWLQKCRNFDGGFGAIPGAESHAAQIFCVVGCFAISKRMDQLQEKELLAWFLAERQNPRDGGLNGRPEKTSDVCYSWWVLSSLAMMKRLDWINGQKLREFIRQCEDLESGGIADAVGDLPDVFHTFFGLSGLSLLGDAGLQAIDPIWALPPSTLQRVIHGYSPSTP